MLGVIPAPATPTSPPGAERIAAASVDDVTGVLATLSVVSNDVVDDDAGDSEDFWAATAAAAAAATALETWTRLRLFCSCCWNCCCCLEMRDSI